MDYRRIVQLLLFIFQIKSEESLGDNDDKIGDTELKGLTDLTNPILICVSVLTVSINTTAGTRIDLYNYFSDPDNVTFSPGRYISANISTLGKPQQVSGILENKWGIEPSCTFLIYTKAGVCFPDSLTSASNAEKQCLESGGNKTCTYTCKSGYLHFDGSSSKTYTCSGMNNWWPSINPEDCLLTESSSFLKAKFEVVYELGDLPASQCLQGFDNSLAVYNTTIAQKVDDRCKDLRPGKFVINSFISTTKAFQITTIFSGEFTGSGTESGRSTCLQTLYKVINLNPSLFLHNNTVLCDGGSQSSVSTISIKEVDAGNTCSDNMVLIKPVSGYREKCVQCPLGRYFNGTNCVMCSDGQYQDLVGQVSCKSCPTNTISRNDKTACSETCPPGFTSSDGITECTPCGRDEHWVNATNCERCPADFSTFGKNGVPDITWCKAPCPAGRYSRRGFEPCQDCPFHHYKTGEGQGNCTECPKDQRTLSTGSISSADCIHIDFINRDLLCSSEVFISINNREDTIVDLYYYFSDPDNVTYSPGRYISVNTSTLVKPQQVIGTLKNKMGIKETCTFLIYTKAVICFTDTLPPVPNAQRACISSGGGITCTYTCRSGYVYFDGTYSKSYKCSIMNDWSPSINPENCLLNESPSYKAKFEVVYELGNLPAASCLQGFDNLLAVYNTTISGVVDDNCRSLMPGHFIINSFSSRSKAFQITTEFSGEFTGNGSDSERRTCLYVLYIVVNNYPPLFLHNNTVVCDGGSHSSISVKSIREVDAGNTCSDNMVLIKPESGNNELCVPCPSGRYFNGTNCLMCADGYYQDIAGQMSCESCPANTVSREDKTSCLSLCPPGFTSSDGLSECKPCKRDEHWVNATNCKRCPADFSTVGKNGVPDITGCIAPCPAGRYSSTGYEPCQDCPFHHYKTVEGQGYCTKCPQYQMTLSTGSNNSADCIDLHESPKVTCPSGKTWTVIYSEVTIFTVQPAEVVISDNIDVRSTTYNPPYLTMSQSYIGSTRAITVIVTDKTGRTYQCEVQVYTAAAPCSPYSLETPIFGQKNCSATSYGFQCDLKCGQSYTFYDDPGLAVKTLTCTTGNPWPQRIPACTPVIQQVIYTSLVTMTYNVETRGQTISSSCFENAYKSAISTATPLTEQLLRTGCSGGLFPNDNIEININEDSSFATQSISIDTMNITYSVEQKPSGYEESKYSACATNVFVRMRSYDISIKTISSQQPGCPNLIRKGTVENSKGFICSTDKKTMTVGVKDYCLNCPAGTYLSAPNTCTLCPLNTYKNLSGASDCIACGSGRGTHITGATSSGQCLSVCSVGTFSIIGMPPCNQCPKNTYWVNSTYCQACPNEGKTFNVGSSNKRNCILPCPAGKHSFTGYEPCQDCPLHHYKTAEGRGNCTKCPQYRRTLTTGSNSSNDCFSVGFCSVGSYSTSGMPPCKLCPMNTYSVNSTYCQTCPNGGKTFSVGSSNIGNCVETDDTSPFPGTAKGKETSTSGDKTSDDLSGKENNNYFNYFVVISTVSVILLVLLLVVVAFLLRRRFKKRNSNYTQPSSDVQESQTHSYTGLYEFSESEESGGYTELDSIQRGTISAYEPSISDIRDYINTERHVTDETNVYSDLKNELNYENLKK